MTDDVPPGWNPIATAPIDGTRVWLFVQAKYGLSSFHCIASYHPDGGWCCDELREATAWKPLGKDHHGYAQKVTNDAGISLIKQFEGLRLAAYQDVAGVWTIGYGHTGDVNAATTFTDDQADAALRADLIEAETAVNSDALGVYTSDNQFSAMVALCYNIGAGHFGASSVVKDHRAGQTQRAADAFLLWDKAMINGVLQVIAGLSARRRAERALYLSP